VNCVMVNQILLHLLKWKEQKKFLVDITLYFGITVGIIIKLNIVLSYKNKNNLKDAILSNVENIDRAINNSFHNHGPVNVVNR
jgi:hypothetical protein